MSAPTLEKITEYLKKYHEAVVHSNVDEWCKDASECPHILHGADGALAAITINSRFEYKADLIVKLPLLGVFGSVHKIDSNIGDKIQETVREIVDQGSFARRIFVQAAEKNTLERNQGGDNQERNQGGDNQVPALVELVLVFDESIKDDVMSELHQIHSKSDLTQHIGISLLHAKDDMATSFCWLLTETRKYFKMYGQSHTGSANGRLQKLTLGDWRLKGKRQLNFFDDNEGGARLCVIHGLNGAGKSSAVEALEFAVTGKIEHLHELEVDLAGVVQNVMHPETKPSVTLEWKENEEKKTLNVTSEQSEFLDTSLKVGAFRLNQTFMDRLVREKAEERLNLILSSFFPRSKENAEAEDVARRALGEAEEKLQMIYGGELPVKDELGTVLAASDTVELDLIDRAISKLINQLKESKHDLETLKKLDAALEHLDAPKTRKQAEIVISLLQSGGLANWRATAHAGGKDGDRLNRWLHAEALADLTLRQQQILETMVVDFPADEKYEALHFTKHSFERSPGSLKRMQSIAVDNRAAAKMLREKLGRFGEGAAPPDRDVVTLEQELHEALDGLSRIIRGAFGLLETAPLLGGLVSDALKTGEARVWGDLTIGGDKWAESLVKAVKARIDVLDYLGKFPKNFAKRSEEWINFEKCKKEKEKIEKIINEDIINKLLPIGKADSPLISAFRELNHCMTVARWGYLPLYLYRSNDHNVGGQLKIGMKRNQENGPDYQGELRLNSAQLSLVALTLFVLNGVQIGNPLKSLILDDPLHSMDGQTMTAVIRFLGRIIPLLPKEWQVLVFLHGEEAQDIFRHESPARLCRLPWLSAVGSELVDGLTLERPLLTFQDFRGKIFSSAIYR